VSAHVDCFTQSVLESSEGRSPEHKLLRRSPIDRQLAASFGKTRVAPFVFTFRIF
jgi:hypothetical protein